MASQYFARTEQGFETGPVSSDRILEMVRSGALGENGHVRSEPGSAWIRVGSIPKLKAAIPAPAVVMDDFGMDSAVDLGEAKEAIENSSSSHSASKPRSPGRPDPSSERPRAKVAKTMALEREEADLNQEIQEPMAAAWFDKLLDVVRNLMTASKFEGLAQGLTLKGHIALMLGAAVALVYSVVNAVKMDSLSGFAIALAVPVGVLAGQYVAAKFINAGRAVLSQTPGSYRSKDVFSVISLCYILLAAAALAVSIWGFIQVEQLAALAIGVAVSLALVITSTCFLYPSVLGLSAGGSGRAGAEGISLIGAVLRSFVAMSPILYGTFTICGGGLVSYSLVRLVMAGWTSPEGFYYHAAILSGMGVLAIGCAIPLVAYFLFVLLFLQLDALSAVFEIAENTTPPKSTTQPGIEVDN